MASNNEDNINSKCGVPVHSRCRIPDGTRCLKLDMKALLMITLSLF